MANPKPRNYRKNVVRQAKGAIVVGSATLVGGAIKEAAQELPNIVQTMGKALDLRMVPRSKMKEANEKIAADAQKAVVQGWRRRLPYAHPATSRKKRLSGTLGPALADPANLSATTDRVISFANTEVLGREAKHWYRVNYGAAGSNLARGRQPKRFVMLLNGETFGSFRDELPADPISYIPKFIAWHGDAMYPKSKKVKINENGARAARFLELGHSVVARQAPAAYDKLWRDYLTEKGEQARQRLKKKDIHVNAEMRFDRTGWKARVRT
jgi:hypothetical protein